MLLIDFPSGKLIALFVSYFHVLNKQYLCFVKSLWNWTNFRNFLGKTGAQNAMRLDLDLSRSLNPIMEGQHLTNALFHRVLLRCRLVLVRGGSVKRSVTVLICDAWLLFIWFFLLSVWCKNKRTHHLTSFFCCFFCPPAGTSGFKVCEVQRCGKVSLPDPVAWSSCFA